MFLRIKKVNDGHYLYLSENSRKNPSKTPSQKTIKYLGRIENYSEEEINKIEYFIKNNDPTIFDYILKLKNRDKTRKTNKKKVDSLGKKCIICGFDIVVHLHHLIPVCKGGLFEENNLVCLCPNHHEMLHKGLIIEEELKNYIRENEKLNFEIVGDNL